MIKWDEEDELGLITLIPPNAITAHDSGSMCSADSNASLPGFGGNTVGRFLPMFYFCFDLVAVSFAICRPVTFAVTEKHDKPSTEEKNFPK